MKLQITILVLALLAYTLVESCISPGGDCKNDVADGGSCEKYCDCVSDNCSSGICGSSTATTTAAAVTTTAAVPVTTTTAAPTTTTTAAP